jgi:hypothetical protein
MLNIINEQPTYTPLEKERMQDSKLKTSRRPVYALFFIQNNNIPSFLIQAVSYTGFT